MCTVTFIPRDVGYYLAMNRDEQLARIAGLPPRQEFINGRAILCPSEPGGGTWISLNDTHASFALINWYAVSERVKASAVSRGEVVRTVGSSSAPGEAEESLAGLPLSRIHPFRLIGIFPEHHEIVEWKWDLKNLVRQKHPWRAQQWISSGYDETMAQAARGLAFQKAQRDEGAGTVQWLRRLHSSHRPQCGPLSTCMHRAEAATVSYTEISVSEGEAAMRYQDGSPCTRPRLEPLHKITFTDTRCYRRQISTGCACRGG